MRGRSGIGILGLRGGKVFRVHIHRAKTFRKVFRQEEISACHVKKLRYSQWGIERAKRVGIHGDVLKEGVNCNGDMLVEFHVSVSSANIFLRGG